MGVDDFILLALMEVGGGEIFIYFILFYFLSLKAMGIWRELHLVPKGVDTVEMPATCYNMTTSEKDGFLQVLKDVRVPDGYTSNISHRVHLKQCKIFGLKSHDDIAATPSNSFAQIITFSSNQAFDQVILFFPWNLFQNTDCASSWNTWERHYSHVVQIGEDISSIIFHSYGKFSHAFSKWRNACWTSSLSLDVFYWEVSLIFYQGLNLFIYLFT